MKHSAVILTGAGSGIGRSTAIALSQAGYPTVLSGRTKATLDETAGMCEKAPAAVVVGDVADPATSAEIVETAKRRFGGVDAIVNNAGVAPRVPIEQTDLQILDDAFKTNMFGPALLVRAAWPELRRRGRSVVVNVSSMAAIDPLDGFMAYGASKAAIESLTRSIHGEGEQHGIEAYSLRLSAVDTELFWRVVGESEAALVGTPMAPGLVGRVIIECIAGHHRDCSGGLVTMEA